MQQSVSKMYAFAKELEDELKHTPISVSMLHPAPIKNMMQQIEFKDELFAVGEKIASATRGLFGFMSKSGKLKKTAIRGVAAILQM